MLGSEHETGPAANVKRLSWILTLPLIVVTVVFAAANFEFVSLDLWPFAFSVSVPLSVALLTSLVLGLLVGGLAAWLSAGGTRHRARQARRRADELEREVARLRRERAAGAPGAGQGGSAGLPAPAEGQAQGAERAKRSATGFKSSGSRPQADRLGSRR